MHIRRNALVIAISVLALAPLVVFAWTGPTATPPGNNVDAPINVGTTDQVKNGGLGVNALTVFGNSLFGGSTGSNAYLNFGATAGEPGYGIRDNDGTLEFKNLNGSWASLQSTIYTLVGEGGGGVEGADSFGGMFTTGAGSFQAHSNPLTAAANCPAGYAAHNYAGGAYIDQNGQGASFQMFYCGKSASGGGGGGGGPWATSGNNIYNTNTGNVGIGTASPVSLLQVGATLPVSPRTGPAGNGLVVISDNRADTPSLAEGFQLRLISIQTPTGSPERVGLPMVGVRLTSD